ncbi:MAG: class I SAM-dependent methyltransferase [Verrucomicrobiota bacterium]
MSLLGAAPAGTPAPQPRLRLRLSPAAETAVRRGHPWVYAERLRERNREGLSGELAVVYDRNDRFLALGLYDPDSPIRLRVLHAGKPVTVDDAWWRARLAAAIARRTGVHDARTNGLRWVNGESDGWPALVVDQYAGTLVLKLYSAVWLPRIADLVRWLGEALQPGRIVLRLSRNAAPTFEQAGFRDGQNLLGDASDASVVFLEDGLRFWSDVVKGQKTGFFLDQRENRRRIGASARGLDVLNAFSFSGGFSLHAARGGARSVTDLDISPHALEAARRNFALNAADPGVGAARHDSVQADAFEWLERSGDRFDVVICDPPSLAKREAERAGAIEAYHRLAMHSIARVRPGGLLLAASCSAHVTPEEFYAAVTEAAHRSGRSFGEPVYTGHAPDHPATFDEARYLKAAFLGFEPPA